MSLESLLDQPEIGFFINGDFRKSKQKIDLISPLKSNPWKSLYTAQKEEANQAIQAAADAFSTWQQLPAPSRGEFLRKIGDAIIENRKTFAHIMTIEMGKAISQSSKEIDYAAGYFHWFAGEAERLYGMTIPSQYENKQLMIQPVPIGVCGIITPWNFPIAMAARKIAPALAAGCTVVCKPSPESPVSLLLLGEICRNIHLPKGVVNILAGPEKEIGQALLDSHLVKKVSFTGSTEVGRYLYRNSAATLKKLTLELGGHAPFLVFNDANLDKAITGSLVAKFRNNGQSCIAANRFLVQEEIYDAFAKKFIAATAALKVGDPLSPETDISTVLHPASKAKVQKHIDDALKQGAKAGLLGKNIYEPTVLLDITPEMLLFKEETFGPLAGLTKFKTGEDGIRLANQTEYGLAAYAYTESLSRAHALTEQLDFGIITLNDGLPSTPQASFGGMKNSGFGREGGPTGLREYLTEKYITIAY